MMFRFCRSLTTTCLLLLAVGWLFSACSIEQNVPAVTGEPRNTIETSSEQEALPAQKPDMASGELRLWWSKRQILNPLLDNSQSGQSVNGLIFDGLFSVDEHQMIQPALADKMFRTDSSGNPAVDIRLAAGFEFHNNQPVTAADVKACIDFIKANSDQSPYALQLSGVIEAEVVDDLTIRLLLEQPDPWLAYALTFPVVPAVSLKSGAGELFPGTGIFRMEAFDANTGLLLIRHRPTEEINALERIRVIPYAGPMDALKALEEDQIDLIDLSPDLYHKMSLRGSLRFDHYLSGDLVFLLYNTNQRRVLADENRLAFVKRILTAAAVHQTGRFPTTEQAEIPLPQSSFILADGYLLSEAESADTIESVWPEGGGQSIVVFPAYDRLRNQVAEVAADLLDQAGVKATVRPLGEAAFRAALLSGQFDIAILEARLPLEPDVTWLYGADRPEAYSLLDQIAGPTMTGYDLWIGRLTASLDLVALVPGHDKTALLYNLYETDARSVWSCLLFRQSAVLYGDRVIGQCKPVRQNPYNGVEELWIWPGRSS
ncbi:MAG: hypothetical protein GX218_09550 [Clostridiaceae bacterium]|nr:hypothetical protein [Clostridiaceae bacterium]